MRSPARGAGRTVARKARRKGTVLVTGFGPFPGVPVNASADLAVELARRARQRYPRLAVVAAVLPVSWYAAPARLRHLIAHHRPILALHIGVSSRAKGFVIETLARNQAAARPDCRSLQPGTARLLIGGAPIREVTLPAGRIERALQCAGHPVLCSDDAGDYLCNAVLYHSLSAAARAGGRRGGHRAGFIHIPTGYAEDGITPLRLDRHQLVRGALTILRLALASVQPKVNRL